MDPIADSMRLRTPSVRSWESLKALIHHRKTSQAMFIKKLRFACFLKKSISKQILSTTPLFYHQLSSSKAQSPSLLESRANLSYTLALQSQTKEQT